MNPMSKLITIIFLLLIIQTSGNAETSPAWQPFFKEIQNFVKSDFPEAVCESKTGRSLLCQMDAQIFYIHRTLENGRFAETPDQELGPNTDGLVLRAEVMEKPPSDIVPYATSDRYIYWTRYKKTYRIMNYDFYIRVTIDYGQHTDLYQLGELTGRLEYLQEGLIFSREQNMMVAGDYDPLENPVVYKETSDLPGAPLTFRQQNGTKEIKAEYLKSFDSYREIFQVRNINTDEHLVVKVIPEKELIAYEQLLTACQSSKEKTDQIPFGELYEIAASSEKNTYLITPFIEGKTFFEYFKYNVPASGIIDIQNNAALKLQKIIEIADLSKIFLQIGYVNDDIGPSNLLLDKDLKPYMIDMDFVIPLEKVKNPSSLLADLFHLIATPEKVDQKAPYDEIFPHYTLRMVENEKINKKINDLLKEMDRKMSEDMYFPRKVMANIQASDIEKALDLFITDLKKILTLIEKNS
ncbi:MAG: hypothetical protein KC618_02795 [Candidatus Omnitrophica bacterium]|nr:hypothetical protein [Candidatus Omnitrophota bacterium]